MTGVTRYPASWRQRSEDSSPSQSETLHVPGSATSSLQTWGEDRFLPDLCCYSPDDLARLMREYRQFCEAVGFCTTNVPRYHGPHECNEHCTLWNHETSPLYFCVTSGNFHLCTEETCSKRVIQKGCEVCVLSGRSYPRGYCFAYKGLPKLVSCQTVTERAKLEFTAQTKHTEREDTERHWYQKLKQEKTMEDRRMAYVLHWLSSLGPHEKTKPPPPFEAQWARWQQLYETVPREPPQKKRVTWGPNRVYPVASPQTRVKRKAEPKPSGSKRPRKKRRAANLDSDKVRKERLQVYHDVLQQLLLSPEVYERHKYAFCVLMENVWHLVAGSTWFLQRYSMSYRLEYHCVAVMYLARIGISVTRGSQSLVVIPEIPWLGDNMHRRGVVAKYQTRQLTAHTKTLTDVIASCEDSALRACHQANIKLEFSKAPLDL